MLFQIIEVEITRVSRLYIVVCMFSETSVLKQWRHVSEVIVHIYKKKASKGVRYCLSLRFKKTR